MFSIGEFSRITGLSIKTLRFYDEKGLLKPTVVDPVSGYRYYNEAAAERARVIARLRAFEFPLAEISTILGDSSDEADILDYLLRQRQILAEKVTSYREIIHSLDQIVRNEKEARAMAADAVYEIEMKDIPAMTIAGVRMRGRYSDCGKGFAKLGRALGRHLAGKPFCLYYDGEYREQDADLEPCFPVRPAAATKAPEGISIRELPAARCLTLLHRGPYEELGRSYEKLLAAARERGLRVVLPTREVYLKGPGMIFRGNPRNYLTEIQIPVEKEG